MSSDGTYHLCVSQCQVMGTVSKGGGEGEPYLSAALQYTAKPLKVDACWQSDE
jgi:hypothetical protein